MKPLRYLLFSLFMAAALPLFATAADPPLDRILDGIEQRYAPAGFSARFTQTATLKAMDITDTASGTIRVKRPGKMRWAYETPEPQLIVTDGQMLWIYRPEDNQVMVGAAPEFFGGGKGAGFLSDMKQMREDFDIAMAPPESDDRFRLKLVPRRQGLGVAQIYVGVSKKAFDVEQILTVNAYGDETRITLSDIAFENTMADSDFVFAIPEDAEILQLDQ
ncbi:MAG: outer membrane lipoprotein carrier protein LolA [Desulfobacterales bacterium]|nr:outer membrane lipoprotein carrier protein LolA [Desulfobacterales bacterium]